jgi:predicted secreted protein
MRFKLLMMGFFLVNVAWAEPAATTYNRIHLSHTVTTEVPSDQIIAVMMAEQQDTTAALAANKVNTEIKKALETIKDIPEISAKTLQYTTAPVFERQTVYGGEIKQKQTGWKVSQSLELTSGDEKKLGELLATLQKSLDLKQIRHEVSSKQREVVRGELVTRAIEEFKKQSMQVAIGFGFRKYNMVKVTIDDNNPIRPLPPIYRSSNKMMAMAEMPEMPPVALNGGSITLSVTIHGDIELE